MSKDVEGECNAHLYIADNYGDNEATMRCQKPKGHNASHQEIFYRRDDEGGKHPVTILWERDERCWHKWVRFKSEEGKKASIGDLDVERPEDLEVWENDYKEMCEHYTRICTLCHDYE